MVPTVSLAMDPKFGMNSLTPSDTVQPFLLAKAFQAQCGITSTETVRTIRDGEPRTAISTFTQLLSPAPIKVTEAPYLIHEVQISRSMRYRCQDP